MNKNIIAHTFAVGKADRNKQKKHRSFVIWFTGLSGSGKSTLANEVEKVLMSHNVHTYILDGDHVRKGLCKNLTFSPEDRTENLRRVAEVTKLMVDAGIVVMASFVSPYKKDRASVREIVGPSQYIEVSVTTPLEICEARDVKGLYKKARKEEIANFTGISAPYEFPDNPDLEIDTSLMSLEKATAQIVKFVKKNL